MRYSYLLAGVAAAASPLHAQEDAGPTLAVAHAFSVDGPTTPGGAGTLFFTSSDFSSTPPGTWSPQPGFPLLPDFGALFAGLPATFDVDALSMGLDWILALPTGEVPFPLNGSWGALSVSVDPATTGTGATGAVAAETAPGGNGAAGDLFAYVLPGSNLPAPLVDVTFRAQDSTEIDIGASGNLDAHDIYMSLIYGENPQFAQTLPFPPAVYFSATQASVSSGAVPAAWWQGAPQHGSTIFQSTWTGAGWSQPAPFLTAAMLGLNANDPLDDVDALAVDLLRGYVLFSTCNPGRDPLLFLDTNGPGGHSTYRLQAGHPAGGPTNVSNRIGIGIGNLDAICTLDPGTLGGARYLGVTLGTPYAHAPGLPPLPGNLGASVFRRRDPSSGNEQLLTWMTGVPGSPPPSPPGVAIIALTLTGLIPAGLPGPPAAGYVTGGLYVRPMPGHAGFAGLPQSHVITIPASLNLTGAELFFVWGAFNTSGFTVSFPTGITL